MQTVKSQQKVYPSEFSNNNLCSSARDLNDSKGIPGAHIIYQIGRKLVFCRMICVFTNLLGLSFFKVNICFGYAKANLRQSHRST